MSQLEPKPVKPSLVALVESTGKRLPMIGQAAWLKQLVRIRRTLTSARITVSRILHLEYVCTWVRSLDSKLYVEWWINWSCHWWRNDTECFREESTLNCPDQTEGWFDLDRLRTTLGNYLQNSRVFTWKFTSKMISILIKFSRMKQ